MLAFIGQCIEDRRWKVMLQLYWALVRLLLEHCMQFWSPCYRKDVVKLEKVEKSFTRMLLGLKGLNQRERLNRLELFSLEHQKLRGDLRGLPNLACDFRIALQCSLRMKEFTSSGAANMDTGKVTGSLETRFKWADYGLTFTEKWNTDNTLGTEITIEDQLVQGLKIGFDSSFSPNTGKKSGKIKTGYKREHINLGLDVDFDIAGPAIRGAFVFGFDGWLAGYQMTYETAKSRVSQSNFAVGYRTEEFQLHTNVLAWTAGNSNTRFGIAAKYMIDKDATCSIKVNNSSLIGLGYSQMLKPGAGSMVVCAPGHLSHKIRAITAIKKWALFDFIQLSCTTRDVLDFRNGLGSSALITVYPVYTVPEQSQYASMGAVLGTYQDEVANAIQNLEFPIVFVFYRCAQEGSRLMFSSTFVNFIL
eukprot:g45856.t1